MGVIRSPRVWSSKRQIPRRSSRRRSAKSCQSKKGQRQDKLDEDASKQQASWLKFHYNKASTRIKCGFLSGKPKDSIFKVPETLEGKVGVMGSGKEMTRFTEAKKFSYQYV